MSAFLEGYIFDEKKRKKINLLFKGSINSETKKLLKNLRLPEINILRESRKIKIL